MQIFDVVVSIQMKSLKTDVEKGLVVQAICHQLVGPNREGKSLRWNAYVFYRERESGSYSGTSKRLDNGTLVKLSER